jgi:hypothetical protein
VIQRHRVCQHHSTSRLTHNPLLIPSFVVPVGCDVNKGHLLTEWEPEDRSEVNLKMFDQRVTESASSEPQAGVLLFAGEALAALDSQQVHGAMASGERAAQQIIQRMQHEKGTRGTPNGATSSASSSSSFC